jgi:hypothetical protein
LRPYPCCTRELSKVTTSVYQFGSSPRPAAASRGPLTVSAFAFSPSQLLKKAVLLGSLLGQRRPLTSLVVWVVSWRSCIRSSLFPNCCPCPVSTLSLLHVFLTLCFASPPAISANSSLRRSQWVFL